MAFCRLLHRIYLQALLLTPRALVPDDGYAAREGVKECSDSIVELAHVDEMVDRQAQNSQQ